LNARKAILTTLFICQCWCWQYTIAGEFNHPGGVAEVLVPKISSKLPVVRYGLKEPTILDQETHWRILLGLDLQQLPGDYVVYTRQDGEDQAAEFVKFQVRHKTYPLTTQDQSTFIELPSYEALSELDFTNSQPPSLPMQLPIKGDWNQQFGQRLISPNNDDTKLQNYTTISASSHSLVKAPQAGIISSIIELNSGTATVIIDHGRGLFSLIHNISELAIEIGNGVVSGAVIGKVPEPTRSQRVNRHTNTNKPEVINQIYWQVQLNDVFINPLIMTQL